MENASYTASEKNQRYISAYLNLVRGRLELYKLRLENNTSRVENSLTEIEGAEKAVTELYAEMPSPPTIERLTDIFGLSSFEKECLMVCAGVELDSNICNLVAFLQGSSVACLPTFSLMLAALPNAHWSAISPGAPLRYWHMIELECAGLVTRAPIKVNEHVLHYLVGVHGLGEKLEGMFDEFTDETELVSSHRELSDRIIQFCIPAFQQDKLQPILLTGAGRFDKNHVAAYVCRRMRCSPFMISAGILPSGVEEIIDLARTWNREAALKSRGLILDYEDVEPNDVRRFQLTDLFIQNICGLIFVTAENAPSAGHCNYRLFEVSKPTGQEQKILWTSHLEKFDQLPKDEVERLVSQFNFNVKSIQDAGKEIAQLSSGQVNGYYRKQFLDDVWSTCCKHSRPAIGGLAQRIESMASMEDLVLPEAQKESLKEIVIHAKFRSKVYSEWGFSKRTKRGMGITVLFSGESGTGKTMAAEVLANELKLDLYRVDLSQVVNKYIGETEKNLKKIFDAAEDGGAILLFDEADALFGKRSEVKDSHDRYANVEVGYLLQRMEAYRGLAILTTNLKSTLDKAWMRRIRFVVEFPFPDVEQRIEIWKRAFPSETPIRELDSNKLGRLSIAGGSIKNIAMNAAFFAANENKSVGMQHIQRALRNEYEKMEKPLTNAEVNLIK